MANVSLVTHVIGDKSRTLAHLATPIEQFGDAQKRSLAIIEEAGKRRSLRSCEESEGASSPRSPRRPSRRGSGGSATPGSAVAGARGEGACSAAPPPLPDRSTAQTSEVPHPERKPAQNALGPQNGIISVDALDPEDEECIQY
eukprot:gene9919-biopygen1268